MGRPSSVARSRSPAVAAASLTASRTRRPVAFSSRKTLTLFVAPASASGPYLDKSQATIALIESGGASGGRSFVRPYTTRASTRLASARPHSAKDAIRPALNEGHTLTPSAYHSRADSLLPNVGKVFRHSSRSDRKVWSSRKSENTWTRSLFFIRTCTLSSKGLPGTLCWFSCMK